MRIVITAGEPAGIGPDLIIQLAQRRHIEQLVVVADADLLQQRAQQLGLPLTLHDYSTTTLHEHAAATLSIIHTPLSHRCYPGQLDPHNAQYVLATLQRAVDGCMRGEFDALVTAPVQKSVINQAGIAFSGHTEWLAAKTATEQVVMMLVAGDLRVSLVTTHLPLKDVSAKITSTHLQRVIRIVHSELQRHFGCSEPHIAVLGVNPHAGENGHLGREEIDTIIPCLDTLRKQGLQLLGPLPADTAFTAKYLSQVDVVLAMYHDQGLPVLKHHGFGRAVNVTLGLPIIRTSVDHGTALDLAGTGQADGGSFDAALACAMMMIRRQQPE